MSKNIQTPVSNQDVLKAVQAIDYKLSEHIKDSKQTHEDILSVVNTSFTELEDTVVTKEDLKQELASMVTKEDLNQALAATETRLVTKVYLDDKLSDLKGDLVELVRKEDHKVNTVVSLLHNNQSLSVQDIKQIDQVRLFPKTI